MLRLLVNEVGKTQIKNSNDGNAVATSVNGVIAVISKNKLVLVYNSISKDCAITSEVQVIDESGEESAFLPADYDNLTFNPEGTMIVLWNKKNLGIVDISNCLNLNEESNSKPIAKIYILKSAHFVIDVLQVKWHPIFTSEIIVLLNGNYLLIYHTLNLCLVDSTQYDIMPINTTSSIINFTFGNTINSNDWQSLTLYLLSNSNNSNCVYTLSPFIPPLIRNAVLDNAHSRAHRKSVFNSGSSNYDTYPIEKYIDINILIKWCEEWFESQYRSSDEFEGCIYKIKQYLHNIIRISQGEGVPGWGNNIRIPCLQGPMKIEGFSGNMPAGIPCDIAVLNSYTHTHSNTQALGDSSYTSPTMGCILPPVLLITYTDSTVFVWLQSREIFPQVWDVSPRRSGVGSIYQLTLGRGMGLNDQDAADTTSEEEVEEVEEIMIPIKASHNKTTPTHSTHSRDMVIPSPELIYLEHVVILSLVPEVSKEDSSWIKSSWNIVQDTGMSSCV